MIRSMEEVKQLGDFVSSFLKSHKIIRKRKTLDDISEVWSNIVGRRIANGSRVVKVFQNVLTVEVESPAISHEISVFMKSDILAKISELFPKKKITSLKCITSGRKR